MKWNRLVRQTHRWLSIVFTVAVIATIVAFGQEEPAAWVSFLPLPPLALLWCTGVYMFVLPYAIKRRSGRGPGSSPTFDHH
jgi:hypothetical protein